MKSLPLFWALVVGAVGFLSGLLGPAMVSVDDSRGPMFGVFVTGPAGLIAGFVLGLGVSFLPFPLYLRYAALGITCAAVAILTFYFSMPTPVYQGRIIDAEIVNCERPSALIGNAIERWETEIARTTLNPRPGWKELAQRSAQTAAGVILQMHVFRERPVYENRKPWNRGTLTVEPWQSENEMKLYYAREGAGVTCKGYLSSERKLYFPFNEREDPPQWPPAALPNLFDMQILGPVPPKYRFLMID